MIEDDEYEFEEGDDIGNRLGAESSDHDSGKAETALDENSASNENAHPYSVLTPELVIDAIERLGYVSDARILALNSYENRVYQVGVEGEQPVIVKFYRPGRWSEAQILEEHLFTQRLKLAEVPVVCPLEINGETLFKFSVTDAAPLGVDQAVDSEKEPVSFYYTVYPRQGGRAPELDNLDHLYQLGEHIGRIHMVGKDFQFSHRKQLSYQWYGQDAVDYLLSNGFIPEDLNPAYKAISTELLAALSASDPINIQPQISLHGDCHSGNVLWRDDKPHFVDFDDAMTGPAIQDIWMLLSGDENQRRLQLSEVVEGYETFNCFDTSQLKYIEPLRALRVLNYNRWLAERWSDPAFPKSFPWFNTQKYWSNHILELKELMSALSEPVIELSR